MSEQPAVYTMRDLGQQPARIMAEIQESGQPAFITRHGRYIAMIAPLTAGQVESQVLARMARELGAAKAGLLADTETATATGEPS